MSQLTMNHLDNLGKNLKIDLIIGKKLRLQTEWKKLILYCKKKKIYFQTSPFSVEAVRMMRDAG